jgi:hypothetical protein
MLFGLGINSLLILLVFLVFTIHAVLILNAEGGAVNKWLTLTDATFCTELLAMLLKKLLKNRRSNKEEKGE